MKVFLVLLFTILSLASFANEIDKLRTNADVNKFLAEKANKKFIKYPILEIDSAASDIKKYNQNKFYKLDIDNNGLTDLLISGKHFISILDKGNDIYTIDYYNHFFNSITLLAIDSTHLPKKIIIYQSMMPKAKTDTLIYKFNGLIEYNSMQMPDFSLDSIILRTNYCYGECPVFMMKIHGDRTARFHTFEYNRHEGRFLGVIPQDKFDELIALLRYINFPQLSEKYKAKWTDDQTVTTYVYYKGKNKYISDYGGIGTFGLRLLYKKIFDWRESIDWKR